MNNRAVTLSLLMAVLALFFVNSYVTSIEDEAKKRFGSEVLVIKAKRDIKEMETILEDMMYFDVVPKRFLEPAAISLEKSDDEKKDGKEKKDFALKNLIGTIAIVPIKKGEQVTYNKITEPNMRTGLSPQIAPGKRAIAIPVNETSGVAKLVKPGDRVDLIAVVDTGGGKEGKIAKTILQDILVLSAGRQITNNVARVIETDPFTNRDKVRSLAEDFSFSSVTLEVEPLQAQILVALTQNGDNALWLSLRNNEDIDRANLPGTTLVDILGADAARVRSSQAGRR